MLTVERKPWFATPTHLMMISALVFTVIVGSFTALRQTSHMASEGLLSDRSLTFVPNKGHLDQTILYEVQGSQAPLFFTKEEILLPFPNAEEDMLRLRFIEGNMGTITAVEQQEGVINYFIGDDPARWHSGLPTYAGVTYPELYPGISLSYGGQERALKGTFVVQPYADPNQIRWTYQGGGQPVVNTDGALHIPLATNSAIKLIETAPIAWQNINNTSVPVSVEYMLLSPSTIGLAVGDYNPRYPLTIDPTITYSTFLGGTGGDCAFSECDIAVDDAGNIYVAGTTDSRDFPLQSAIYDFCGRSPGGDISGCSGSSLFVTKFNADGTLAYSTYFGSSSAGEAATGIAVTGDGQAYVTGFGSLTPRDAVDAPFGFPLVGANAQDCIRSDIIPASCDTVDAFLAGFSTTGTLTFSTLISSDGRDEGLTVAVDDSDNVYVAGTTDSTTFPTSAGAFQGSGAGSEDVFLMKYDPDGSITYSTLLGGDEGDVPSDVVADANGVAYVAGTTNSGNFPTQGALQSCRNGNADAFCNNGFVSVFNANGSQLTFSTYIASEVTGTGFGGAAGGVAVDDDGSIYISGRDIATAGIAYVAKLNDTLDGYEYQTELPEFTGTATGIDVANERLFVTGTVDGASATQDAFYAALSTNGTLLAGTRLGGSDGDTGVDIDVDAEGNAYIVGNTESSDFPTSENAFDPTFNGPDTFGDVFVTKIALAEEVSAVIPSGGGTIATDDGSIQITFPSGAVSSDTTVTIIAYEIFPQLIGSSRIFGFFGLIATDDNGNVTAFDQPYTVTFTYDDELVQRLTDLELSEDSLSFAFEDNFDFSNDPALPGDTLFPGDLFIPRFPCDGCSFDPSANTLIFTSSSPAAFALEVRSNDVYLPLIIR